MSGFRSKQGFRPPDPARLLHALRRNPERDDLTMLTTCLPQSILPEIFTGPISGLRLVLFLRTIVARMEICAPLLVFVLGVIAHAGITEVDLHDVPRAGISDIDSLFLRGRGHALDAARLVKRHRLASVFCACHKIKIISLRGCDSST